jgi:hypothetical protein
MTHQILSRVQSQTDYLQDHVVKRKKKPMQLSAELMSRPRDTFE